jgi:ABC-type enterochelin transport system permease subunit
MSVEHTFFFTLQELRFFRSRVLVPLTLIVTKAILPSVTTYSITTIKFIYPITNSWR